LMERMEKFVPILAYIFGKEGVDNWKKKLAIILVAECAFLAFALLDLFSGGKVHSLGIHPREFPFGLIGIFFAPFLHTDFTQFLVNSLPFAILSGFVLMREDGITTWTFLTFMEVTVGGLGVWAFGRLQADHNGVSGLILAYFGFLLLYGVIRREARASLISVAVIVMYGGFFWGTLPSRDGKVSWEGHLFGFLIGCMFASWEGDIAAVKAAKGDATSGATGGSGSGSAGRDTHGESAASSERAPLTADDVHDDLLHDAENQKAGTTGAAPPK